MTVSKDVPSKNETAEMFVSRAEARRAFMLANCEVAKLICQSGLKSDEAVQEKSKPNSAPETTS